jgi:hypothetical protein
MKGNIYAGHGETCGKCGGKFEHFERRGLWCPSHPDQHPRRFVVRFGRKITRRFSTYDDAFRFLNGVRYETDQGKFDIRDYRSDCPLGFANLVKDFLKAKRHLKAVKKYEERLQRAVMEWENRSVKTIKYKEIEIHIGNLKDEGLKSKYIYDIKCCLEMLFRWVKKSEEIEMPEFPDVQYKMGFRKIVSKEYQRTILDEIYKLTWDFNPKIYVGCLFLATYPITRPDELRNVKEKHLELENKRILLEDPKNDSKYIYLTDEHVELLESFPQGFGELYFFRHHKGNGGAKPGQQFGKDYLYKWWRKACMNLGIEGVSLYPGTKHSTVMDMRKRHSPETCKRMTGHRTNKAFDRYLMEDPEELRSLYQEASPDKPLINLPSVSGQSK